MRKYSFLVFHLEYLTFLKDIQELGVVHVIEKKDDVSEEIQQKYQLIKQYDKAIKKLERRNIEQKESTTDKNAEEILREINDLQHELDRLHQEHTSLKKEIVQLEPWGNFSVDTIKKLQNEGFYLRFFTCSEKKFNKEWIDKYNAIIVQEGTTLYFVTVKKGYEPFDLDNAEETKPPDKSVNDAREELKNVEKRIENIEQKLDEYAEKYIPLLEKNKKEVDEKSEFDKVIFNTEKQAADKVLLLEGWVPQNNEKALVDYLDKNNTLYLKEKATPKNKPPILLKNKKFASLFEPIGKLFSLPDYQEMDLTPFFAPFFMLFFGFCLGDAGYGLLILLIATLYKRKADKKMKPILSLGQFLGIATVLFGLLSGTIFGVNLIDSGYKLTDRSIEQLRNENMPDEVITKLETITGEHYETKGSFIGALQEKIGEENTAEYSRLIIDYTAADYNFVESFRHLLLDPDNMFTLALILGLVQIMFGMFVKGLNQMKQYGFKYSISTFGWLLLLLSAVGFFGLKNLGVAGDDDTIILKILVVVSLFFIIFFNDPEVNIFARFGKGLWDIYSTVTGVFGDLLSYIRLFALGLSSAILGFVVNDIGIQILGSMPPVIGHLIFAAFLIALHTLNILISSLGAFVHPMRLTFVEFYKNAGFSGGGKEYKPFTTKR